ncbi:MAG: hypothetical protein HOY76_07545 [Streptomyces sp.]|nr:hypothetical protein [Streptomyces sp.]
MVEVEGDFAEDGGAGVRTTQVTTEMMEWADRVFVMDRKGLEKAGEVEARAAGLFRVLVGLQGD